MALLLRTTVASWLEMATWVLWAGVDVSPAVPNVERPRPAAYALQWTAPELCPGSQEIDARIAALVGEPDGGEGIMEVEGVVTAKDGRYALDLRTRFAGHVDTRALEATRCGALADSAALVVAIALDPSLDPTLDPSSAPTPVPEPNEEPVGPIVPSPVQHDAAGQTVPGDHPTVEQAEGVRPQEPRPNDKTAAEPRPTPSMPGVAAWISPGVEYGSLPTFSAGLELGVGALWRRTAVEVGGVYSLPQRGPDGLYQQGIGMAYGCARLFAGAVEFPLCLGLNAGALRVDSRGLAQRGTAHGPWVGPAARVGVRVATERVWLRLAADAVVPVARARVIVGDDAVFEARPASVRVTAGLGFFFTIDPAQRGHR